jgi:hypothetical protein
VPAVWADFVERWYNTSTLTHDTRGNIRVDMAKVGRWLATVRPQEADPGQWTRATCAAWAAAIDQMAVGDWSWRHCHLGERVGAPLTLRTKARHLANTRAFFRDLHEWEWIPRRFDPSRALAVPAAWRP